MASIPTAFHSLEKKEMNVSEYSAYLRQHRFQMSIRAIKCVECGDFLVYCKGDYNVPYFKHAPSHEGHSYCSLYREGKESKTNESLIRKRFFHEEDISLNYELFYKKGIWKSLITIPPFKSKEINENEENQTIINIIEASNRISIPVDKKHFQTGEIKKILLSKIADQIKIKIEGNSTRNNISYDMDGFQPNTQLYSSLITQKYAPNIGEMYINLTDINSLICKRISGYVYTGRHYLVFSNSPNFNQKYNSINSIEIKRMNLINDKKFNYYLFDIIFNKVDEVAIEFCNKRNCVLVEKDDALIIWPPIITEGNYRYYRHNQKKMYISFENQTKNIELQEYNLYSTSDIMKPFFKIQNINSNSYYVTRDKRSLIKKDNFRILSSNPDSVDKKLYEKIYYLSHDVVISNNMDSRIKLGKKNGLLLFNNQLDRLLATNNYLTNDVNNDLLIDTIRYSREYVKFNNQFYTYLIEKHSTENTIIDYIEHCKRVGTIKKKAMEILLGKDE